MGIDHFLSTFAFMHSWVDYFLVCNNHENHNNIRFQMWTTIFKCHVVMRSFHDQPERTSKTERWRLYALISPFGCAFVYVMWIHLNNSLASWKMHKIILSIQWKWNAVFWWQCLWPMRLARPSQCESHAFSLSLAPSLSMCVFFNGYHFTQTLPLFGVLYFDTLYCVVYVLSDRECACSRSQGYCCKNILTCTFT